MAVPDLIFRQKQQTQKTAMNVPTMLADFLDLVTPKFLNKHLQKSLSASLASLLTNGQCSVTSIGRGIESDAQESTVLNAPIGYSATPLCIRPCLFFMRQ